MLDEGCTYCGLASGSTLATLLQIERFFFGDVLDLDVMPAEVPELDFRDFPLKLSVEFSKTQNHQE